MLVAVLPFALEVVRDKARKRPTSSVRQASSINQLETKGAITIRLLYH